MTANADNRKWDFTNWSAATVSNLKAGADWSDIENPSKNPDPTEISKDNCFWEVTASGTAEGTTLTANGVTIAELEGLQYVNTNSRSLAIAVNYGDVTSVSGTGFGPYNGPSYLWLGSNKKNYFVIPSVKAGATIKMGVESHKLTDARGVNLYVGRSTSGTQLKDADGNSVSAPKAYTEQEWFVPTDLTDAANADGTYDILIYNTNGCHLYYIEVVEEAAAVDGASFAYVYDSTTGGYDLSSDRIRRMIEKNNRFTNVDITDIDVSNTAALPERDALLAYDVVVVNGSVKADNPFAATLKSVVSYVPMLNLNANMYTAWGYGEPVATGTTTMNVAEAYRTGSFFSNPDAGVDYADENGNVEMFTDGQIMGVNIPEGSYFADDNIIATAGDAVTMHMHQGNRNTYMYLPYAYDNTNYPSGNLVYDLLLNVMQELNSKKADVPQVAVPTFTEDYKQMNTDVTIKCGTKGSTIYYTLDGTTPTEASTKYEGKFNVATAGTVVKAIAYADGYNASEVGELAVSLYTTSAAPSISVEQQEGKAIVTLTSNEEGATLYYNITGKNSVTESSVYTEPLEITNYTTISAFAGEVEGKKPSEVVSQQVFVTGKEVREDVVSHMDANSTDWTFGSSEKAVYYTEGNKNGYNFYTTHEETVKDSQGNDSTALVIDGPANVLTDKNPGKGWAARSYGQGMLWEKTTFSNDIDDTNTEKRYRGETAFDCGATNYHISTGNVKKSDGKNNDPYSAYMVSTEPFKGPFDIKVFTVNLSKENLPKADIWVSTTPDGAEANWVRLDSVTFSKKQRWVKKSVLSYEGTDEVYVKLQAQFSSVGIADIIILNHGDKSEEILPTAIKEISSSNGNAGEVVRTMVYSINGTQLSKAAKGINIIKEVYADGTVKTRKVMVK